MWQTVEAEIDIYGNVRLLEPLRVTRPTRALVTLLGEVQIESSTPPEITAPEERSRVIDEILRSMQSNPIPPGAPHFTREELHERR
jgi:hypothetical protein